MRWRITYLELDVGDAFEARFVLGNAWLEIVAEVDLRGRAATLRRCHMNGDGAHSVGITGLRAIAALVMERLDVDQLRLEGAPRTTGAGPGRAPAPLVFRRR